MNKAYPDAIAARISRRTYLDTPLSQTSLAVLQQKIADVNAESGLSITWLADGKAAMAGGKIYGMFHGVKGLLLLKGNSSLPYLREKIGYYGEMLILDATLQELGTCWVGGSYDKAMLCVPEDEELICIVPVGNVAKKENVKEKLLRGVIRRKSKSIDELLQTDVPMSEELHFAMKLVQLAPSTRNQQKATFVQKDGVITCHVPDDFHLDMVDLGICKLHFECGLSGKFELGNGGKWCQA